MFTVGRARRLWHDRPMSSPFTISRDGAVAILTHDDGKANTFTQTQFEDLLRAFDEIEKSDATAVLYRGRPGYFSAGLNLKVLPTLAPPQWESLLNRFGESVMRAWTFPKPIVAEVTGHAIGAGAMFGFAADVRVFAKGAFKFGLNEVPNGMPVPAYGVEVARAASRMSDQMELIAHGRMISPEEALEMRIAESIHDDPHAAALDRAKKLSELPSGVYALTKNNLRAAIAEDVKARMPNETRVFIKAVAKV